MYSAVQEVCWRVFLRLYISGNETRTTQNALSMLVGNG